MNDAAGARAPGPPKRWFWLLPLLAIAAWWPIDPYWQSDDYLALHYARDGANVLHDFAGPQYGATDVWLFYRPLITASFWLDGLVGGLLGGSVPVSMYSNVLAHGVSTLLLALVWRRWLADGRAFAAALLWALLPSHLAALAWGVGRVDSHTAVWLLAATWAWLRCDERALRGEPRRPLAVALCTAAAMASKELAFVLPPLLTLLAFVRRTDAPRLARVRQAFAATAAPWLVFALYLPLRWIVLGRFGGYAAADYWTATTLPGLGHVLADLLVPLRWSGPLPANVPLSPQLLYVAATLPPLAGLLLGVLRAPKLAAVAAAVFLLLLAPVVMFLAGADNPHNLRYYYVGSAALCGLLVAGGRWLLLPLLLALATPFVLVRSAQHDADTTSRTMHRALLREVADGAPSPLFVAGLPHANALGTTVMLHFGIDRLLAPPFGDDRARLFALRPLAEIPEVFRLHAPTEPPFALPLGSTWFFADPTALGRAPAAPPLPDLPITGDRDGVFDLSSPVLHALVPADSTAPQLRFPGVVPPFLRLTLFTANGYLTTICSDHGAPGASDGTFDVRTWVRASPGSFLGGRIARAEVYVGDALVIPTTIDRVPEFPVLLEAGTLEGDPRSGPITFVPTHRSRRLLTFRFDRGYPAWVRRAQGR